MGLPGGAGHLTYTPASSSLSESSANAPGELPKKFNSQIPGARTPTQTTGPFSSSNNSQVNNGAESSNNQSDDYLNQKQQLVESQIPRSSNAQNYKSKQEHYDSIHQPYPIATTYYNSNTNDRRIESDLFNIQIDKMLLDSSSTTFEFERQVRSDSASVQQIDLSCQSGQQSSRSSSSTSLNGIGSNLLMNIEQQPYEQEEYQHSSGSNRQNNQMQTVPRQQEHMLPHSQPHDGHNRNHQEQHSNHFNQSQSDQQQQQQQQVSSHSDHQLVISSHNSDFLTYNYNEHDDICSDGWTTMALDNQSNNNNCSSRQQNQNDSTYDCESPFRLNMNMNADMNNEQQRSCAASQQTYSQSQGSTVRKIASKNLDDFNNNTNHHQHHHVLNQHMQNTSFLSLAPVPIAHPRDQAPDSYSIQSSANHQEQFFTNATFYSNSEMNANGYNQDAEQMYDINRYNDPSRHQVPVIRDLPDIRHNNDKPIHCYPQAEPSSTHHPQYYDQETHSTLNSQLYQQPTQLDTFIQQVVFKPNDNCNAHHQDQPPAFEQATSADQYQAPRSAYTSLQQLTMNCDNYANQVSTTTATLSTGLPGSASANKTRSLKGRRGRPRKKGVRSKNKVNGKLWEFIRDLLLNEHTNPSFIRWERREDGVFKFVQSDKVAKMWGERKQNPKMTYEKLSRAMRYYYKSKVLLPVFGRRLVYKFGPNATGWLPVDGEPMY